MLWCRSKWFYFFITFLSQPEILQIPLYSWPTVTALGTCLLGFLSLIGVNPICSQLVSKGRISPEMCWGEWGAAPQWHITGQQEETLRLWLLRFHALSWDLSSSALLWGEDLERCWGSLGSLVFLAPLRVRLQGGLCLAGGEGGNGWSVKPSESSWHIHGMWSHHDWSLSLYPRGGSCVISLLGNAWSEGSGCRKSLLFHHRIPQGYVRGSTSSFS